MGEGSPTIRAEGEKKMAGIPWSKIRAEWLKGGITHQQLADKYGVKVKTIRNRASNEGWKNEKGKIREKTEEETCARIVRARVNHLERLMTANDKIISALEKLTEEIEKNPVGFFRDKQNGLRNAESVTRALQTAAMTQRDLYRLPTIDQKFAAKKWKEQLKLEQAKAKKDETTDDKLVWVIHEPAAEDGEQDA